MTVAPASAGEAVANGAQLLDEKMPGWWHHVHTGRLDLGSNDHCVLGQLKPRARLRAYCFRKLGFSRWGAHAMTIGIRARTAADYGFWHGYYDWSLYDLESEWVQVIKSRQEMAGRPSVLEGIDTWTTVQLAEDAHA